MVGSEGVVEGLSDCLLLFECDVDLVSGHDLDAVQVEVASTDIVQAIRC